jgi:hypothetical protein
VDLTLCTVVDASQLFGLTAKFLLALAITLVPEPHGTHDLIVLKNASLHLFFCRASDKEHQEI